MWHTAVKEEICLCHIVNVLVMALCVLSAYASRWRSRGPTGMRSVYEKVIQYIFSLFFLITTMLVRRMHRGHANLAKSPVVPEYEHASGMQDQHRELLAAGRSTRESTAFAMFESGLVSIHQE